MCVYVCILCGLVRLCCWCVMYISICSLYPRALSFSLFNVCFFFSQMFRLCVFYLFVKSSSFIHTLFARFFLLCWSFYKLIFQWYCVFKWEFVLHDVRLLTRLQLQKSAYIHTYEIWNTTSNMYKLKPSCVCCSFFCRIWFSLSSHHLHQILISINHANDNSFIFFPLSLSRFMWRYLFLFIRSIFIFFLLILIVSFANSLFSQRHNFFRFRLVSHAADCSQPRSSHLVGWLCKFQQNKKKLISR